MTDRRKELARLAAATRGAIEWHRESGEGDLPVPEGFEMPNLGTGVQAGTGAAVESPAATTTATVIPDTRTESANLLDKLSAVGEATGARRGASGRRPMAATAPEPIQRRTKESVSQARERGGLPTMADVTEVARCAAGLQMIRDEVGDCTRCSLHSGRTELVFGYGQPDARVMFVGDGPSPADDGAGLPFVDEAGVLLGRMIRAMGLQRGQVYLTSLVKCRTPGEHAEVGVEPCGGFLDRQIGIVQPEVIIALGELAARRLTGSEDAFPRLRGQWFEYQGIPVIATFHPQALIQHPASKGQVWKDLKLVMRHLELPASKA